jgi:internalin A
VGDERVGKTSVINRLLGNSHDDNQTSTQGIDISELNFEDYHCNIWDFAGQELTHQTHQFFLTERSLYIYVIDAQKEDNQARDLHWLNTIKSYSANSPIIIVINHSDQNLNYQFDKLRYKDDFQIVDVIHTSACNLNTLSEPVKYKLGNTINTLHEAISRQLPKLPGIDRLLPESWHEVKKAMENFKKTKNVIDKDSYDNECRKAKILGKPLQAALLKILNSIGTVVAYPNDFRLRLTQILKPEWVTNAVYKIVRSPSDSPGFYSEEFIGSILDGEYTYTHQQWLVDLLIKFEIGFRLQENGTLLIPMRLPSITPDFDKSLYQSGLNIRFNYHRRGLLKLNTLPQLIVRMHHYVDNQTSKYWRHGMFITLGDCRGVIIADEPNQCIEVKLTHRNEDARNLLQWIRSNIEAIEKSQINANTEKKLPYLEEIALFDTDYSHAIGYESYQRVERSYKKEIKNLNLEVIDSKTGEIYDKDFDVSELLGLYQDNKIRQFSPHSLLEFLTQSLLRLTDFRSKIINEQEDDINDRVRESLSSRGYIIADQSRGGFSNSGKGAGERDIVVLNQYGQQATLIEAMILKSAVKKTIAEHYKKLTVNYNTHGNPVDFLITYAKVKNFNNLWKKYKAEFEDFIDLSDIRSNKSNIKIGHTSIKLDNSDQVRIIYHIMVNFGVKVDH